MPIRNVRIVYDGQRFTAYFIRMKEDGSEPAPYWAKVSDAGELSKWFHRSGTGKQHQHYKPLSFFTAANSATRKLLEAEITQERLIAARTAFRKYTEDKRAAELQDSADRIRHQLAPFTAEPYGPMRFAAAAIVNGLSNEDIERLRGAFTRSMCGPVFQFPPHE